MESSRWNEEEGGMDGREGGEWKGEEGEWEDRPRVFQYIRNETRE